MNSVQSVGVRFASLHRPSIKPGVTGYFTGTPNDIKPGAVLHIIRLIDGPPKLLDPMREGGEASRDDLTLLSLHAYEQQSYTVDEYVVQADGSAAPSKTSVPSALGFNWFTGVNECITGLELKNDAIHVTSPPSYYRPQQGDQPVKPLAITT